MRLSAPMKAATLYRGTSATTSWAVFQDETMCAEVREMTSSTAETTMTRYTATLAPTPSTAAPAWTAARPIHHRPRPPVARLPCSRRQLRGAIDHRQDGDYSLLRCADRPQRNACRSAGNLHYRWLGHVRAMIQRGGWLVSTYLDPRLCLGSPSPRNAGLQSPALPVLRGTHAVRAAPGILR